MNKSRLLPPSAMGFIFLNIIVFCSAIWFGAYHYSGALAWGDTLDLFRNSKGVSEFVSFWYENINGRLGQAVLTSWFLPFRWGASSPQDFPWWFVSGLALSFSLLAPVHLVLSVPCNNSYTFRVFLLPLLVIILWSFNSVSFYNREFFILMELVGYSLPIYLVSALVIFLARVPSSFFERALSPALMLFVGVAFSLLGEQYLVTVPILVSGMYVLRVLRGDCERGVGARLIVWIIVGLLIGVAIYWLSPGQQLRRDLLKSLAPFTLWQFYEFPVVNSYQMLFQLPLELSKNIKFVLISIHTIILLLAFKWAVADFDKSVESRKASRHGAGVFVLMLLLAYHACFSTLLVAAYLPGYAYVFPLLLLSVALVLVIVISFEEFARMIAHQNIKLLGAVVSVMVGIAVLCWISLNNWKSNAITANLVRQNNQNRMEAYGEILREVKNIGARNFVLTNCPLAHPTFGWTMEPPWGLSGYFSWVGYPSLHVFLQGNPDFPADWDNGEYTVIKCVDK